MTRRFRRRKTAPLVVVLVLFALVAARLLFDGRRPRAVDVLAEGVHRVERVVDGDTLLLTNRARVRLMGVDTPETKKKNVAVQPWGPEATAFTENFVAAGEVRLAFDKERIDKYERFLAYVYVGEQMLNEELLRAGLAWARTDFRFGESYKKRFRDAEAEAKQARRGIWSAEE